MWSAWAGSSPPHMALSLSLPSLSANHLSSPVKSCSENALGDHRAFPLLKTLLNHARRRSLAPPFPPHFPVLAPFPAAAGRGRRVLHVGGLGAERGGWSAGCLPVRFAPTAIALAIQPRLTLSVYPSSQLQFGSRLSSLPPFLLELWFGNSTRSYFASLFNLGEGTEGGHLASPLLPANLNPRIGGLAT